MAKTLPRGSPNTTSNPAKPENPLLEARAGIHRAENLRRSREYAQARKICETVLKQFPDYAAARHTLGLVLADKHDYAGALPHLIQAVMLNPKDGNTQMVLAGVYLRLGSSAMAIRTLKAAQSLMPDDPSIMLTLGEIYRDGSEYELAADAFRRAWALDNSMHAARFGVGLCCTHLGKLEEAAEAFEGLAQDTPISANLIYSLCQLPAPLIKSDEFALIDRTVPEPEEDRAEFENIVLFAKAAAFDKAGHCSQAWDHLVDANRQIQADNRNQYRDDCRTQETMLAGVRKIPVQRKTESTPTDDGPISLFILGPSRSGKTTMERLISTCDGVKRGYENLIIENTVQQTFQEAHLPPRQRIVELPPALDELFRSNYRDELAAKAGTARVFTNTLPGQIYGTLRIASILLSARFIFVKRELDDNALRIYMRLYKSDNNYAYDIGEIREHLTWYHQMIDALVERLPERSLVIHYEDMIADPATALASAAEICGLTKPAKTLPQLGDDRGCAKPYKTFMEAATNG